MKVFTAPLLIINLFLFFKQYVSSVTAKHTMSFFYVKLSTLIVFVFFSGTTEAFPVRNATGFHRLWSALSFLFCIVDGAGETAMTEQVTFLIVSSIPIMCCCIRECSLWENQQTTVFIF